MSLPKPAFGSPCNGCGLCCIVSPCQLAVEYLGATDKCPALERSGDRYSCGLVTDPARHLGVFPESGPMLSRMFGEMLGVGRGCDASLPCEQF